MLNLGLSWSADSPSRVLCLGAHADDIEIGCGGTVLEMIRTCPAVMIYWVVFGADQERAEEALDSAHRFLKDVDSKQIVIKDFRESFFPYVGATIKEYFEQLKQEFSPDLIFTHYRSDLHQDHRLISELTWNTFRDHLILEYEIPKYDGDFGVPNFFVPLDESVCRAKIQYVLDIFKSQNGRAWFDSETFFSLLRLRGMECHAPSKYAEAFYCRKTVLEFTNAILT